jgi:hypothetical protein
MHIKIIVTNNLWKKRKEKAAAQTGTNVRARC